MSEVLRITQYRDTGEEVVFAITVLDGTVEELKKEASSAGVDAAKYVLDFAIREKNIRTQLTENPEAAQEAVNLINGYW